MAPSTTLPEHTNGKTKFLRKTGTLDTAHHFEEVTPTIGREYPKTNIVNDLLHASNADELLRDLAITSKHFLIRVQTNISVSERGVVFFRAQDNLTNDLQKEFIQKLGELSGKPESSTLHVHPVLNDSSEFGVGDHTISTISSVQRKKLFNSENAGKRRYDSATWHSDIQFEPFPADYTSLRLTQLPSTGGDTLWASGYDIYDYFSPAYQKFFDGLSAEFIGEGFIKAAEAGRTVLYTEPRGHPENSGKHLSAVHPVVRTNPVTGWKSIFALGNFPKRIIELNNDEGEELIKKFTNIIYRNHDITVRFKWRNKNDIGMYTALS